MVFGKNNMKNEFAKKDPLYPKVKTFAKKTENLTSWKIQDKFKVGYRRTAELINMLKSDKTVKIQWGKVPSRIKLKKVYEDKDWRKFRKDMVVPIGAETASDYKIGRLSNGFSAIMGGATGSGKSSFIHCAMVNLIKNTKVENIQFVLIDPRRVELFPYEKLPNLLYPIIYDLESAKKALKWCAKEAKRRFELLSKSGDVFADEYNKKNKEKLPEIFIVIDEFSDLMSHEPRFFSKAIRDILTKGLFANMNIIIGTSRLSKEIYPKKIVDAFSCKIAFVAATKEDSKILLDQEGAEELRGKGDMLMVQRGYNYMPMRLQGFFVSEQEIKKAVKSVIPA